MSEAFFPLFLRLAGKDVLVVGAGRVAERKIEELLHAGAHVRVVAPEATLRIRGLAAQGRLVWHARPFEDGDADGAWLVFAATSDPEAQKRASDAGQVRRAFVVAIDDLPNASACSASVVRRAPFTIAISSSAQAPALTRLLREILEQVLPEPRWVDAARALRARWRAEGTPIESRFGALVRELTAPDRAG
jgi:siroheme synthase-like protein